ncbi:MAG: hypothetical protein ACPGJS_20965 [Flammeovirgaceae bacterium]
MNHFKIALISIVLGTSTGLSTLFLIPSDYELMVWVILIITLAWSSLKLFQQKLFWNSFLFSIATGAIITVTHLLFIDAYLQSHPTEIKMLDTIKIFDSYTLTLLLLGPIYWLILASISGLIVKVYTRLKIPSS